MEPEIPRIRPVTLPNDTTPGGEIVIDFFLWVLHGQNVSSNHNFYPVLVKYQSLVFYSKPYTAAYADEFDSLVSNPCKLLGGACPIIPIIDRQNNAKYAYLPPLLFSLYDHDPEGIKSRAGLYHLRIKKTDVTKEVEQIPPVTGNTYEFIDDKCEKLIDIKIISHAELAHEFPGRLITYSILFHKINVYCSQRNINPEHVVTGIFSCQTRTGAYIDEYDKRDVVSSYVPVRMTDSRLQKIKVFVNSEIINTKLVAAPCIIKDASNHAGWAPLGTLQNQGCALNVLSFYGLIPQSLARENVVCLPIQGTSIYKIVDYIYNVRRDNVGCIICRLPILYGLNWMYFYMKNLCNPGYNYAVIIKMYNEFYQSGTTKLSQIGHTVSLSKKLDTGVISFVDPQLSRDDELQDPDITLENITTNNRLYSYIHSKYGSQFNYIDIIITLRDINNFETARYTWTTKKVGSQPDLTDAIINHANILKIVPPLDPATAYIGRDPSINYGGSNKTRKNKKHTRQSKNKKHTRQSKGKRHKQSKIAKNKKNFSMHKNVKKNKSFGGGNDELDNFEKMMTKIDSEQGIKTELVILHSDDETK